MQLNGQDSGDFSSGLKKIQQETNHIRTVITEKQIAGNIYLNKQFIQGTIIKNDGTEIKDVSLRYNIYEHTMQFKRDGTVLDIAEPTTIKRIIYDNKIFVYTKYNDAKKIKVACFQLLNEGSFQLLKMYNVALKETTVKPDISDSCRVEPSRPGYYLRYDDSIANLINSKNKLIKILQPIPQKIIDYIQENVKNVNDEKELLELLEYINKEMN